MTGEIGFSCEGRPLAVFAAHRSSLARQPARPCAILSRLPGISKLSDKEQLFAGQFKSCPIGSAVLGRGSGGVMMPPDITILIPSSTLIFNGMTSPTGTSSRNPEVGLGVVGRNTLTTWSEVRSWTSPTVVPVTKPKDQMPRRGYSTRQTWRKAVDFCASTVSKICLVAP